MSVKNYVVIVSAQMLPLYLPIKHFKPEKVILLASAQMKSNAESLRKTINGMLTYSIANIQIVELSDHFEYAKLYEEMIDIAANLGDNLENTVVNITGGTKPMSFACFEAFNAAKANCIYYENNRVQYLNRNQQIDDLTNVKLTPKEYFNLYGFSYSENDKGYGLGDRGREFIEELLLNKNQYQNKLGEFYKILSGLREDQLVFSINDENQNERLSSIIALFINFGIIQIGTNSLEFKFPNLKYKKFAFGGWLEQYLYNFLKDRGIAAVMNVEITKEAKNELDVVFIHNNNLYVIECKSQLNDKKQNDDLYKLNAQHANWGSFAKIIYVSFKEIEQAARVRAADYKIDLIDGNDLTRLSSYFNKIIK